MGGIQTNASNAVKTYSVLPRWAGILLAASAVLTWVEQLSEFTVVNLGIGVLPGPVLMGIALAWMGWTLWSGKSGAVRREKRTMWQEIAQHMYVDQALVAALLAPPAGVVCLWCCGSKTKQGIASTDTVSHRPNRAIGYSRRPPNLQSFVPISETVKGSGRELELARGRAPERCAGLVDLVEVAPIGGTMLAFAARPVLRKRSRQASGQEYPG